MLTKMARMRTGQCVVAGLHVSISLDATNIVRLLTRKSTQNGWLNSFIVVPGFVQTDKGNAVALAFGVGEPPVTVQKSTSGMYNVLTTTTKEKFGEMCVLFTRELMQW